MIIDCAQNDFLAKELVGFLQENGYLANLEEGIVTTSTKIPRSILESFLEVTNRSKHKITSIDSDTYLIAMPMDLEDVGLESCEFCGYLDRPEAVQVHRRSHQAL